MVFSRPLEKRFPSLKCLITKMLNLFPLFPLVQSLRNIREKVIRVHIVERFARQILDRETFYTEGLHSPSIKANDLLLIGTFFRRMKGE